MRTIIVAGFLGSGKTTFLLRAINYLHSKKLTFAMIINEFGDLGVDNQLFKQLGEKVWEVLGGCICCTSVSRFQQSLAEIRGIFEPDYLLIEPSGIANPVQVKEGLSSCLKETDNMRTLALLDSDRIDGILEFIHPLTVETVKMASTVLITKIDIATPGGIEKAELFVDTHNPQAAVVKASLHKPLDNAIMEVLFR
ncbi:MAG: GTP-binding protein [Desulfobacteraceae bacterium]|jgi:G3E family GTPase